MRALVVMLLALASVAAAEPLRVVPGSAPQALAQMDDAGDVDPETPLAVTVVLGVRDRDALEGLIAAQQDARSPRFGRWLDATELADRFGPRREDYERVRRWFAGHGFTVARESPYRLSFVAQTTAATAAAALATPIRRFRRRGGSGSATWRGPVRDVLLPEGIATSVRGILGLDDLPKFRPTAKLVTGQVALAPADFATVYGVTPLRARGITGAGRAIAVIARSNFDLDDVATFASRFLQPPRIAVTRTYVDGSNPGVLADQGEEVEVLIDTQWAGALAPDASVNVVISPRGGDIPDSLHEAVAGRLGDVVTISFSLCEAEAPAVATEYFDVLYALANAQGQTVVVASGDGGATECQGTRTGLAVNALASSPHAIAVGGTSFALAPDGSPDSPVDEAVWNDAYGASGGGESMRFARPSYQLLAGVLTPEGGRALPDVALAASPKSPGYVIVEGGANRIVGGTSAGAPALASLLAVVSQRVEQRLGSGALGQLLPALYRLGSAQQRGDVTPAFRDVTHGDNAFERGGGFAAGPGFDLASGWGAPLADRLAEELGAPERCEPAEACLVPAGAPRRRACAAEWLVEQHLAPTGRRGLPATTQTCRDGDPACDADGTVNGRCTVNVALCVNVVDGRPGMVDADGFPACASRTVRHVRVSVPRGGREDRDAATNQSTLETAFAGMPALPASLRTACTATVPVVVGAGGARPARFRARVVDARGSTVARLRLACTSP